MNYWQQIDADERIARSIHDEEVNAARERAVLAAERERSGPCMPCVIATSNAGAFADSVPCTHERIAR